LRYLQALSEESFMTDSFWKRALAALVLAVSIATAVPAAAGGGVGVTFGFGGYPQPYYGHHRQGPPFYYGPPRAFYAPPPVYYAPPRVYYAPPVYFAPPVYVQPAPVYAPPQVQRGNCREYQSTAMVNGSVVPSYGTACQQPDGTWRLIN
jgi:hypothetical protein